MKKIVLILLLLASVLIGACELKQTAKECKQDASEFYSLCYFSCTSAACADNCYNVYLLSYLQCGED
jgi:hypothetical protein